MMNKPKFETSSLITESVAKIAELFPGAVTEGKVNFDLLRSLLGDEVYGNEAYEFTWVGKKAAIAEAGRPIRKTLRPCVEESKDWDTTGNLYIEGDNLDVLKLLQESYLGKVKLIYIDPPYNTGNDFVYRDNFTQDKDEYDEEAGVFDEDGDRLFRNTESNGRFHSDWCSMMYPRLVLARNLLRNEGVIFISIDDNEQASLKKLCDEVFGERYFIGCFVWKRRTSSSMDQSKASTDHEYVIAYHKGGFTALKGTEKDYAGYSNPDNDPRGIWTTGDLTVGMNGDMRPNQYYDLINPATGKVYKANYNRVWSYTPDSMKRLIDENRVIFPEDTSKRPMLKRFASELKSDTNPFSTWMKDIGLNTEGTRIANALFNNTSMFNYAKPISLVKNVIEQVTSDNDIILDFFSGSATTAHAVMQLNAEDGGNRKFIMVQLPELCTPDSEAAKAGYKNICEIGKERIRRAGEKIVAEGISKTTMKKIGGEVLEPVLTDDGMIEHSSTTEYEIKTESKAIYYLDIGFRVLKLDDTNMKDVYYAAGKYTQDLLAGMEDNIKDDRTDMDLLYACLLDWGLPLSMPHTHEKIDGFTVHTYNEGDLIACFDKQISDAVVKEIAKRQPLRAVFRDSSFNSSPEKINVEEIFKLLAPNTNVRVI